MTTVLLLHMNGTEGSTTFTDATGRHTVTPTGAAQISTTFSYFGNGAALFNGTTDYLNLDGSSDFAFGTGDFTIDFRLRLDALSPDYTLFSFRPLGEGDPGSNHYPTMFVSSAFPTNGITFVVAGGVRLSTADNAISANKYYHVALTRKNGLTRLFLDGVQQTAFSSTYVDTNDYLAAANRPIIGTNGNAPGIQLLPGRIDEFRIVKGYAVWDSDFIPPAAPYTADNYYIRDPVYLYKWAADYNVTLRTWFGRTPPVAVTAPFSQEDWPLPRGYTQPIDIRTITETFNLNLIGQDFFPTGERVYDLPTPLGYPTQLRTWLGAIPPTPVTVTPFFQEDWPLPRGPEYPVTLRSLVGRVTSFLMAPFSQEDWPTLREFRQLRSWTWSYNLNLIGQDQLPTGEIRTDLPLPKDYPVQLRQWLGAIPPAVTVFPFSQADWPLPREFRQIRSWTWNYNLNLVGQDQLPTGEVVSDLPPQPPLSAIQLRTWINSVNLALVSVIQPQPFNQFDWPLSFGPRQPTQIFTASFNKNLIGKDALTVGEAVTDRPPLGPERPYRSYEAYYNPNLVGQDQFPARQDKWPLTPAPLRANDLLTWIDRVKLLLAVPFGQSDWPVPQPPRPLARSYTVSFPLSLVGADFMPTGEVVTDLPPRAPQQPIQTFVASFNKNLIGKDQLPNGEIVTDLPPRAYQAANDLRTWINQTNQALSAFIPPQPFNQFSWPVNPGPQQPIQIFTAFYNRNLIGKDLLPFSQTYWPVPTPQFRQPDLRTWIDRVKLLLQVPFRQHDWPNPRGYQQPALSYTASYNQNLIGKDRLPLRQRDWPLTPDARRYIDYAISTNPLLYQQPPPPTPIPHNQFYWPLPGHYPIVQQRYSYEFQGGNLYPQFVSPIPPPPDPTPPTDERLIYNAGNEWQMLDRIREPGPVGWR